MSEGATAEKLPPTARFRDLSDYARPIAIWIARRLRDTSVVAPDVTLAFAAVGIASAICYGLGGYQLALAGAAGMQLKNILDAVDGSLARLQNRPSRVGRFLDSLSDALVAVVLYGALAVAVARVRPLPYAAALALAALLLGLLQGSLFNYYSVRYRARRGGDATSQVEEKLTVYDEIYYEDRPLALALLRYLIAAYNIVYGWQDRLVRRLDAWAVAPLLRAGRTEPADALRDDPRFLTAVSALGPGLQILVLDMITVAGYGWLPGALELFLWVVAAVGTLYALALLVWLRRASACEARERSGPTADGRAGRRGPGSGDRAAE